jgi:hypothetical protein
MREHYQTQRSSLSVSQFFSNINMHTLLYTSIYLSYTVPPVQCSVADPDPNLDPDPPDPLVFGPPGSGSGSISQRYGSGSGSEYGSFFHQVKIVRKTLIPTVFVFCLQLPMMKIAGSGPRSRGPKVIRALHPNINICFFPQPAALQL